MPESISVTLQGITEESDCPACDSMNKSYTLFYDSGCSYSNSQEWEPGGDPGWSMTATFSDSFNLDIPCSSPFPLTSYWIEVAFHKNSNEPGICEAWTINGNGTTTTYFYVCSSSPFQCLSLSENLVFEKDDFGPNDASGVPWEVGCTGANGATAQVSS